VLTTQQFDRRYKEERQARPGDEVVIVRPASAEIGRFSDRLALIAEGGHVDSCDEASGGLPTGWVAFRFRLRGDLAAQEIPSELWGRIRIGEARIRLVDGLRLKRAWMAGGGPTLEVIDGTADKVIVDCREYELSDTRLFPEHCPILNLVGTHEVWLPDRPRERIRFRVIEPRIARFRSSIVEAGWQRIADGWPVLHCPVDSETVSVRGPVVEGEWLPRERKTLPIETLAISLAVLVRGAKTAGLMIAREQLLEEAARHPNVLIRQLARAVQHTG
jgi:hypothetical protein